MSERPSRPMVEIHVPISPTPDFLIRVHYLAASIELFSGLTASEYRLVVTVGAAEREDLDQRCPWSRLYPLEWRWVDERLFRERSYFATGAERLRYPYGSKAVLLMDADLIVAGSLRDFIEEVQASDAVFGVPAYSSAFPDRVPGSRRAWREVFEKAGLGEPAFDMQHSGWGVIPEAPLNEPDLRYSPAYLNYGLIGASAGTMARIGQRLYQDLDTAAASGAAAVKGQVALTLSLIRSRIPCVPLSVRYAFPNIAEFYEKCPEALDIRAFHYNQPFDIDKTRDFQTYGAVEMIFERQGLGAVNRELAECIRKVHYGRVVQDLQAAGMAPISRPDSDYWTLERARDRARELVDRGDSAGAHRILSSIIDGLPRDAHAHYLMALVVHQAGQDDAAALRHYERALANGFDEFWVRYNRGALYLKNNNLDLARADLVRAASLQPDHPGVRALLAQLGG